MSLITCFSFISASGIQPVMVSLRRSHTNVSDFAHGHGRGKGGYGGCRGQPNPRYWNDGCELQTGMYLARSRSNIAALGLNPEAVVYRHPSNQIITQQIPGLPPGHPALGVAASKPSNTGVT